MTALDRVAELQRHVKPLAKNPVALHSDLLLVLALNIMQRCLDGSAKLTDCAVKAVRCIAITDCEQVAWPYPELLGRLIQTPHLL